MKLKTFLRTFLILAAVSILFIPATVLADDCDLFVGGVQVTEEGDVTGEGISGSVKYAAPDKADVLTLNNATITGINEVNLEGSEDTIASNICARGYKGRTLIINLVGENALCGDVGIKPMGIDARKDIIITGEGSLTISNCDAGIWGDDDVTIDGKNHITIDKTERFAIIAKNCNITDGVSLDFPTEGLHAIYTEKDLMIYNSDVTAKAVDSEVIYSNTGNINIVNSNVSAKLSATSGHSYNAQAILAYWGKIRIANSTVCADNEFKDKAAIMAKRGITLNHSEVTLPAKGKVGTDEGYAVITDAAGKVVPHAEISITKAPSTMYAAGKTVTLKSHAKKLKKKRTISKAKAYTIAKANGNVTYAKVKANKSDSKFTVNKSTGKITVKKGLKNGTYKVTVKVTCAGDKTHKGASENVVVTIKIKK